jgi:4-amino-4-deoxy-L-arabinose transferase-like glycosyltransferase
MDDCSLRLGIVSEASDNECLRVQPEAIAPVGSTANRWLDKLAAPRIAVPFLLAFGMVILIVNLGAYPSYTKGEPREAVRVLDILRGGGWILPTQAGIGLPWKPPLMYWLGALISMAAGTVNEWTVRLPSGLLAVGGIVCCYLYVRQLFDDRSAFIAALILATTFQYEQSGTTARVDMTLTFCMEIAFFEFIAIAEGLTQRRMLLYAALAAAVLAKGPIGVALPGIVILAWMAAERRWSVVHDLRIMRGCWLIMIVAGGWYAAATVVGGQAFVHRQILAENLYRLLPSHAFHEPHQHPFYFVELALLAGYLPWTGLAGLAFVAIPDIKKRAWNSRFRYLVIWLATVLVFYNLPRSKRGVYLLALYPALATLTALMLNGIRSRAADSSRVIRLTAVAEGLAFGAAGLATLACEAGIWLVGPRFLASMIEPLGVRVPELSVQLLRAFNGHPAIAVMLPVAACVSGAYSIWARLDTDKLFMAVLTAISCAILATHLFIVPALGHTLTLKYFTRESMKIADGHRVVNLGSTNFDVVFYGGRNLRIGSLGQTHGAKFFICWRRYYRLLPEVSRRRLAIVMTSSPTSLSGDGRMLLLKRSDLPNALSSATEIAPGPPDTMHLTRPSGTPASARSPSSDYNPG